MKYQIYWRAVDGKYIAKYKLKRSWRWKEIMRPLWHSYATKDFKTRDEAYAALLTVAADGRQVHLPLQTLVETGTIEHPAREDD
jgi:hypothetical protein